MGKLHRHKKKEKQEKSKVKLKAKKAILPKGQNVTDTSFKVKKIVIREQLKEVNTEEPLSRRKLNLKELLSHLQHHNTTVRQDALTGLKELLTFHTKDILKLHLPQLVEGILRLVLDLEKDVRRSALKLIQDVLSKVPMLQLVPLLDLLQSYLTCAMTHIKPAIQNDSLLLLDALLKCCPSVVATNATHILPNFLDMISKFRSESNSGRTLTIDLGSKLSSIAWRIKVLSRLNGLLEAIVADKRGKDSNEHSYKVCAWTEDIQVYNSTASVVCVLPCVLQRNSIANSKEQTVEHHIEFLMPLLFEMWLEVAPGQKMEEANILSEECTVLLHCILRNIELTWQCLDTETKLLSWFKTHCERELLQHVLPGFPYILADNQGTPKSKKHKMKCRRELELLLQNRNPASPKCIHENLAICHLLCCVHDGSNPGLCGRVGKYVKRCLSSWEVVNDSALGVLENTLRQLLLDHTQPWPNKLSILECVIVQQKRASQGLSQMLFRLLCDLVLQPRLDYYNRSVKFEEWLSSLPTILCRAAVPMRAVQTLQRLACQGNKLLIQSLDGNFVNIIGNLSTIQVVGAPDELEGKKAILNILFWAPEWRKEAEVHMTKPKWNDELIAYAQEMKFLKYMYVM